MQENGCQDPQSPCCIEHIRLCELSLIIVCVGGCVCDSVVSDCVTPWAVAHQAPLSMELSRQEQWSGSSWPSPGYPNPGIGSGSPALQIPSVPPGKPCRQNAAETPQAALTLRPVTCEVSRSCV